MRYLKTITVNELDNILQKYFKANNICIESIDVASIKNQYKPEHKIVGIGGVLNITFESSRKIKNV